MSTPKWLLQCGTHATTYLCVKQGEATELTTVIQGTYEHRGASSYHTI